MDWLVYKGCTRKCKQNYDFIVYALGTIWVLKFIIILTFWYPEFNRRLTEFNTWFVSWVLAVKRDNNTLPCFSYLHPDLCTSWWLVELLLRNGEVKKVFFLVVGLLPDVCSQFCPRFKCYAFRRNSSKSSDTFPVERRIGRPQDFA